MVTARAQGVPVEVLPGIPGMVGCWHATGIPMTWGDDVMTVLPGTLPEEELARRLAPLDLRQTDVSVLLLVAENPGITQSEVGKALDIQRANMAPLVARHGLDLHFARRERMGGAVHRIVHQLVLWPTISTRSPRRS